MKNMSFDFYSKLTPAIRERYDLMLDTHYILLMCDFGLFLEEDEHHEKTLSASWLYSIQNTIDLFGFKPSSYPQGSISANRLYYEALQNYFGGRLPSDQEFSEMLKGLINFLRLRCDDNSQAQTLLFGSTYKLVNATSRNNAFYRQIDVNIRHSVTALWILYEEAANADSKFIKNSFLAIYNRIDNYLKNKEVWNGDEFEHLTLSSTINVCSSIILKSKDIIIIEKAKELKHKCEEAFENKCIAEDSLGYKYLKLPQGHKMSRFEYYLTFFSLTQIKHLLGNEDIQSIIAWILTNKIESRKGIGLPVCSREKMDQDKPVLPDFGISASMLYLLFYILDNKIGSSEWLLNCKNEFNELLIFCLNTFDDPEYYHLSISENHAKILLLPNFGLIDNKLSTLNSQIKIYKTAINQYLGSSKGNFQKILDKLELNNKFTHVKRLLMMWNLSKISEADRFNNSVEPFTKLGAFSGAFFAGAVKTYFNV
jgi:hypothetical protein